MLESPIAIESGFFSIVTRAAQKFRSLVEQRKEIAFKITAKCEIYLIAPPWSVASEELYCNQPAQSTQHCAGPGEWFRWAIVSYPGAFLQYCERETCAVIYWSTGGQIIVYF